MRYREFRGYETSPFCRAVRPMARTHTTCRRCPRMSSANALVDKSKGGRELSHVPLLEAPFRFRAYGPPHRGEDAHGSFARLVGVERVRTEWPAHPAVFRRAGRRRPALALPVPGRLPAFRDLGRRHFEDLVGRRRLLAALRQTFEHHHIDFRPGFARLAFLRQACCPCRIKGDDQQELQALCEYGRAERGQILNEK